MKYSRKNAPPPSFTAWLEMANENWIPRYEDLQKPQIADVRQSLLVEQEFVCCYCGRSLKEDFSDSHIDHFRPQRIYNGTVNDDLTLSYENFVASCGPPSRSARPSTCGDAKGDQFDEAAHVEPWDPTCEQRFMYGSSGIVQASSSSDGGAATMIRILKLDDRTLAQERGAFLAAFENDIARGVLTAENVTAEIERLRTAIGGSRIGFSHIGARYLETEFSISVPQRHTVSPTP